MRDNVESPASILLGRIIVLERKVTRLRRALVETRHSRDLWKARALRRSK